MNIPQSTQYYNGVVMVEDEGKKDERKLDFTAEGEALAFVILDQARMLAIEDARENVDYLQSGYSRLFLVWEVTDTEESEDYYEIKLSFRPPGEYEGEPGLAQFIFDSSGRLIVCLAAGG